MENEIAQELKELAFFLGGWDELKKLVAQLEENENEAAFERNSGYEGDGNFADNH